MKDCPSCRAACPVVDERCRSCGAALAPVRSSDERDPLHGMILVGKYRLEERIGVGAMGQVYRAHNLALGRDVAVKILNTDEAADPVTARRFQVEARAMSRLRHPGNLAVMDFGQTSSGLLFLVTEILHGRTLGALLRDEAPLEPRRIVHLLTQALAALAEAHSVGVVHRDFKPDNVFVETPRGGAEQVRVIDYGIAKLRGDRSKLTESGSVCGTPDYMAPEQIRGFELDGRADVYAAGVILYEMLTGTRPFAGSLLNVLTLHVHHPPEPPQLRRLDLSIPVPLEKACLRALVKDRDRRIASAERMRFELEAALVEIEAQSGVSPTASSDASPGASLGPDAVAAQSEEGKRFALPLLGRGAALARLAQLPRQALLIVGQPGSGRTRLVEEWRQRVAERGERVVVLRSDPSGARASWRPVRRALSAVLGIGQVPTERELDAVTADRPAERIGLREVFGLGVPGVEAERPFRRREAFAAATGILREAGVALACEDVDRYDRPSVDVVRALMLDAGLSRVIVTATDAAGLPSVETIALAALSPLDLASLGPDAKVLLGSRRAISTAAGDDPDDEIFGRDEGPGVTPLALEQAQRARVEGATAATAAARLDALLPSVRRVLAGVVVAGTEIDSDLLAMVTGLSDVLAPVASLASRGLALYEGGRVVLPSPTLRDALYEALPPAERQALERTLVDLLSRRGEDPAIVAHHHWLIDSPSVPVEKLEAAMLSARRLHDEPGAARWAIRALKRAREQEKHGDTHAGQARVRVCLALGEMLLELGETARAEPAFKEAIAHGGSNPRISALARRGLARVAMAGRRFELAETELLGAIERAGEDALAGDLYLELAEVRTHLGRQQDAETALIQGSVRAPAEPEISWRLLLALAEHANAGGRTDDARAIAEQALKAAEGCTPLAAARIHSLLADLDGGRNAATSAHLEAALAALRQLGDRRATAELLLGSVVAHGANGAHEPGPRLAIAEAGELARQVGWMEGVARAEQALRALG